jgi:hypothetical protein
LNKEHKQYDLSRQILKSGTSVGANIKRSRICSKQFGFYTQTFFTVARAMSLSILLGHFRKIKVITVIFV